MSRTAKPRSRAELGKANRDKGIRTERDVARFLRVHGWPDAERKSDPGWRTSDRVSADVGDVQGTPGLTWQVKARESLSSRDIAKVLAEAGEQAVAAGTDYAIVVQKRERKGNPGTWWAWLTASDLHTLIESRRNQDPLTAVLLTCTIPVRLELADLVVLLHYAGYGEADDG